jgi:hypothetical protein
MARRNRAIETVRDGECPDTHRVAMLQRATSAESQLRTDIERRAYEIFCERGCEDGHHLDDWLQAEREIRERTESGTGRRASVTEGAPGNRLPGPVSVTTPLQFESRSRVLPGEPLPLGATPDDRGTNFSIFSEVAERVELCL